MQLQLHVVSGPDRGLTLTIKEGDEVNIGRGQGATFTLSDPRVSRKHCAVRVADGVVSLKDGGSTGGTIVNHQRVPDATLANGDTIQIGDTTLRLDVISEGTAATKPGSKAVPVAPSDALSELIGQKLSLYSIEKALAEGASGKVFLATNTDNGGRVALKVLWPELMKDEEQAQRFIRAMKTMYPIRHENIVQIQAAGKDSRYAWIAMEYVDGESLTDVIQRIGIAGMLEWQHAFRVAVHVARALEAAAEHHIIHRNIMPSNILLTKQKVAKLGDLMLAKSLEGGAYQEITRPGQLIGNLAYMSPERTRGVDVDERSDIYSLGATLYALLTGHPPFTGTSLPVLIQKVRDEAPASPKKFQLSISDLFEGIVLRMLSKNPDDRYASATALLKDLNRVAKQHAVQV
ncbi:MAG: FHA domain-containing serine/threonine-protein kinase [Planctomycetaceae bacterium]